MGLLLALMISVVMGGVIKNILSKLMRLLDVRPEYHAINRRRKSRVIKLSHQHIKARA